MRCTATVAALLCVFPHVAGADWVAINMNPPGGWSRSEIYAVTTDRQFGQAATPGFPSTFKALAWSGTPASMQVMSPGAGNGGTIFGAWGDWQVGVYTGGHAALWNGTPGAPVDLHPAGQFYSQATAVHGGQQFGYSELTINHLRTAAMWSGSASSYVNMNPPGAVSSAINGAWGTQQGGAAGFDQSLWPGRAGLWSGTPQSFVSVHPTGYLQSYVRGMAAGEQVGAATAPSGFDHAGLWRGTAASFVDLDPGWGYSRASATAGGAQVGWTTLDFSNNTHAVIWFGTAASYHDLSQYLPAGYHDSVATSIATDGSFYYVGGYATLPQSSNREAFLWIGPVPAPPSLGLLLASGLIAARRRR